MKYTIKELSLLANISTRTLRYYDQIDLLNPSHINHSGYRIYSSKEVDILQQIMFYKVLDMPLKEISSIINSNDFNKLTALNNHYSALINKQEKIENLLHNLNKTINNIERNITMNDNEKFEGFKEKLLKENTEKHGKELSEKYNKEFVEDSYKKFKKCQSIKLKNKDKLLIKLTVY